MKIDEAFKKRIGWVDEPDLICPECKKSAPILYRDRSKGKKERFVCKECLKKKS